MTHADPAAVADVLSRRFGGVWSARPANHSSFCATWRAVGPRSLFLKSAPAQSAEVLAAEADGLQALADSRTIRVPAVVDCWIDTVRNTSVLALEWLELISPDHDFGARLGTALAALHRAMPSEGHGAFGWRRDNMIGGTVQMNRWSGSGLTGWIGFQRQQRLGAMRARLLTANAPSALIDAVDAVMQSLPDFFADGHLPRPSLIHGDLWSGNWAMLPQGEPVIYDPAVSCADAEAELAMMELFGGVPQGFWPAYRAAFPLGAGYPRRRGIYQLYHLLNHALLFGGSYFSQSLSCARALAAR
ncbi:MAG TPA: fructosamine kinase family protein [Povalibacter sp.]|nr:fructosamine kinase family protein [Povalibacter sp.]